jgi:hypothetical protein
MEDGKILGSGTWVLATQDELQRQREEGKERTGDIRFFRLLELLLAIIQTGLERIAFEDVQFATSQDQAQLWATLRTAIWVAAQGSTVEIFGVQVATLKKFATGNGRAKKPDMAQALCRVEPRKYRLDELGNVRELGGRLVDDNEVDAIWVARYSEAVDRGEVEFLSGHQRKAARKLERRTKRAASRARKQAGRQAKRDTVKAKRAAFLAAVRAAGRCCGLYRKPISRNRAFCRKCYRPIKIKIPAVTASSGYESDLPTPVSATAQNPTVSS